jgi:hypothetical protein
MTTDLVAELRADVVVPYKANYTPLRAPPSKLMLRAAAEIERVTADFQQVHHSCIHAREVADKALALLKSVHVEQMPLSWQADLAAVIELARNVPPLHPDVKPPHPDTFHRPACPWLEDREADCTCDDVGAVQTSGLGPISKDDAAYLTGASDTLPCICAPIGNGTVANPYCPAHPTRGD